MTLAQRVLLPETASLPPVSQKIVAVALQKGGVGKTTTVVNLASAVAMMGHRVLVVDADPQANATLWLGVSEDDVKGGTYACLVEERRARNQIVTVAGGTIDLLPSSMRLTFAEMLLVGAMGREQKLRKALLPVTDAYDLILIDTPPNLGLLTTNALTAADAVLVPVETSVLALHGLAFLSNAIEMVRAETNPSLAVNGYVATRVDRRNKLTVEVLANLREVYGGEVYRTEIRETVRLKEAPSHAPIGAYEPRSVGAEDYRALALEFMARLQQGVAHGNTAPR